jgi:hypothetical protein
MKNLNWIQVFLLLFLYKKYHDLGMQKYLINVVRYTIQFQKEMKRAYGLCYPEIDVRELEVISIINYI